MQAVGLLLRAALTSCICLHGGTVDSHGVNLGPIQSAIESARVAEFYGASKGTKHFSFYSL